MKKIIVADKKLDAICTLLGSIASKNHIAQALEDEGVIPELEMTSSQKTWEEAMAKFIETEDFSPMEKAEYRKLIELTSSEKELRDTIRYFKCLTGDTSIELRLLVRKTAEIV
jgi:hypothetical protein